MATLRDSTEQLSEWLFNSALPMWWEVGGDPKGGFHEKIDLTGVPFPAPRRGRMIARQAFSYCEAGKMNWSGPWREAATHALTYLNSHFMLPDGTVLGAVAPDGSVLDAAFNLYNQAFALLAFASAHEAFSGQTHWKSMAVKLREGLRVRHAHPLGGFYEDAEKKVTPLRSNPHMHLLEAALAWSAVDVDLAWTKMADEIVGLCLTRFVDPDGGVLREFFDLDWRPMPGEVGMVVEPGHQYEWAYLLHCWAMARGRSVP